MLLSLGAPPDGGLPEFGDGEHDAPEPRGVHLDSGAEPTAVSHGCADGTSDGGQRPKRGSGTEHRHLNRKLPEDETQSLKPKLNQNVPNNLETKT